MCTIKENIERICRKREISLDELSTLSSVSYSTLRAWTQGRRLINPLHLQKVCRVLEVSIYELLFGEKDPHSQTHSPIKSARELR